MGVGEQHERVRCCTHVLPAEAASMPARQEVGSLRTASPAPPPPCVGSCPGGSSCAVVDVMSWSQNNPHSLQELYFGLTCTTSAMCRRRPAPDEAVLSSHTSRHTAATSASSSNCGGQTGQGEKLLIETWGVVTGDRHISLVVKLWGQAAVLIEKTCTKIAVETVQHACMTAMCRAMRQAVSPCGQSACMQHQGHTAANPTHRPVP